MKLLKGNRHKTLRKQLRLTKRLDRLERRKRGVRLNPEWLALKNKPHGVLIPQDYTRINIGNPPPIFDE